MMLQVSKVQSETGREQAAPDVILSRAEALQLFVSFFRRQSSIILFVTFLTMALGVIYLITSRPSFTAHAQLIIDTHKIQVFPQQPSIPIDTAQVESQVGVLKSENVASAVIKKLHLTEDPEFIGPGDGLLRAISSFVASEFVSADQAPHSEFELFRRAMGSFESRLKVTRVGQSYIIEIAFQSYNAERAAQIANAITDAFIRDQLEVKYKATRQAGGWLQDRLEELRKQVSDAEHAVVQFKTKHNIVSTGGTDKPLLNQQQVTELSSQLTIGRAHTAEARARLDRINSVLKTDSSDGPLPDASFGAAVTDTLKNEIVTKLWGEYLDLAALEANWSAKYGADHLAVVNLRNRMREIRRSIFEELKRLGETFKSDYEIAKQRELGLEKELALAVSRSQTTDVNSVTLSELESTAQSYKTIYDNYLRRYMESIQEQSFPISETRVISPAARPLRKSSPIAFRVLAVAGLVGMALGFGIGILRDLSDRVFRSSEQVESLLHANCIAFAPLADATGQKSDGLAVYLVGFRQRIRELLAVGFQRLAHLVANATDRPVGLSMPNTTRRGQTETRAPTSSKLERSLTLDPDANSRCVSVKVPASRFDQDAKFAVPTLSLENAAASPGREKTIVRDGGLLWAVVDAPLSRFSESIRSIKLAVDLNGTFKANRVIGCTSSLPNEGKSTIAFSLAQLMAQVGARTILVDCDLRNPSISHALAPRAKRGLIDVLSEKVEFEKAIWKDASTNMVFLPIVVKFQFANSSEILSSIPMKKLFENLRESYDYIVVDLPPLAPIVDVRAATPIIDSFVFIIEWGRTKINIVEHALGHAQDVYDNLLGVVLNKVDMKSFGRYASHHESYYYNKDYARYGYTE
jgi:polysaccharide biosynthesis transport protein